MIEIPYEPPRREYGDTLFAFNDMQLSSTWGARIEPDPLGPVNKVVTLFRGERRVRSALWPVNPGSAVKVGHDPGELYIEWFNPGAKATIRPPSWYVEVDGRRIIDVPEHETYPPLPPPPRVPLWRRMREVLLEQVRTDVDLVAARLGYHRDGECEY